MSPSEPCGACGATMAEDQRYCLNCGERRGGPRVDFRQHLDAAKAEAPGAPPNGVAGPAAAEPPAAKGAGDERRQRDYAPLAAAGGIAVLGIMLLIGVLIGRGSGEGSSTAAPPQVVTVAADGVTAEEAGGDGEAKAGGRKQNASAGRAKSKEKKGAASGGGSETGNAPVASENQLRELQEQSPGEYSESSAKLPDEIATPGEPPPTDGKAPGGGSGGTTIE